MANDTIQNDLVVSLAYTLTVDGQVVESAESDMPLEYLHGYENIVPGLEKLLTGKKIGDKLTATLEPKDGYGEYSEDEIEEVALEDIPDGEELEAGMVVLLEDEEGYLMEALIKDITATSVFLDFNDPYAGKTLDYTVEVLDIREATEEELENGFPEGADELEFEIYDDHDHDHADHNHKH